MPAHRLGRALALVSALALAGCEMPATSQPPASTGRAETGRAPPSDRSQALAAYYAQVQRDLRARGLMRTDGGGPDTPWTDTDLLRNFERIVFFDEYTPGAGFRRGNGEPVALRKWVAPVGIGLEFGASVPAAQRDEDREMVSDYARRLARATRHRIEMSSAQRANFHVLVMSEDDRAEGIARIRRLAPSIDARTLSVFRDMPRSIHCLVVAFSDRGNPHAYDRAIAWIRAEHPPLARRACFHEELAQALGLADDSPRARPSIFNDDEEFALLTRHDEALLRLLYHPELTPGMTLEQARPVLRRLIAEGQPGIDAGAPAGSS